MPVPLQQSTPDNPSKNNISHISPHNLRKRTSPPSQNIMPSTYIDYNVSSNSSFDAVLAAVATVNTNSKSNNDVTVPHHQQMLQGQTINSILEGTTINTDIPKRMKISSNSQTRNMKSISKTSSPLQMMLAVEENRKMLKSLPDIQPNNRHHHHPLHPSSPPSSSHQQHQYQQQQLNQSFSSSTTPHNDQSPTPFDVFNLTPNMGESRRNSALLSQQTASSTVAKNYDKGLRHFSSRVCAKVEEKGSTTYNEVADELVKEIALEKGSASLTQSSSQKKMTTSSDHKNIRRRVYDALNVLMAIDVIVKDKKEIRWLGIPDLSDRSLTTFIGGGNTGGAFLSSSSSFVGSTDPLERLQYFNKETRNRLEEKKKSLFELTQRTIALQNLIKRNSLEDNNQFSYNSLSSSSSSDNTNSIKTPLSSSSSNDRLLLPFILINAPKNCRVHCEMLEDQSQYFFEFDSPFLINEDIELLRLMDGGKLLKGNNASGNGGLFANKNNFEDGEMDDYGGLFNNKNIRLPNLPSSIISFYDKSITSKSRRSTTTTNHLIGGSMIGSEVTSFFDNNLHNPLS